MSEKKHKKIKWKNLLLIVLATIIACSGIYIGKYYYDQAKAREANEKLKELAQQETPTPSATATATATAPVIPVDFASLQAQYPDIYAWIDVPGTQVSYPIVQSSNSNVDYYLTYTLDGQYPRPGAIYTQYTYSTIDFDGYNEVVYGHGMRDMTMFGSLVDYLDNQQFLLDNSEIKIYTPTKALKYKIYACVVYDDRLIPASFDFNSSFGRQAFIDSINAASADSRSVYNPNVKISADDHLITLSTCIYLETTVRQLVVGVLEDN